MRTWLGAMCGLGVLLLPQRVAAVEPRAVLPEGCEAAVLLWLLPLEMDKPVPVTQAPGWLLRDVGVDRSRLQLTLEGPAGQKGHATLAHKSDEARGELIAEVRLQCAPDLPPPVCRALQTALAQQPRAPSPWQVAPPPDAGPQQVERPEPQFSATQPTRAARGTLLAVWIALLLLLARFLQQRWASLPRWALSGTLAVTLLGLATRLWLAPRGLQHELFHAAESLSFLHGTAHVANGEAVPALVTALNVVLHADDATLYATSLVFAVLSIPALVWFAWRLFAVPRVALVSGALLALLPTHIHFSRSEEFGVVGIALALTSWAALLDWCKTRQTLALLVAAAAGVLAMQSRPEFVALPLLHASLIWALPTPGVLRRRALWFVLALAAMVSWPIAFDLQARGGFPGFSPLAVRALLHRLTWLDTTMTVLPLLAWLALGLAWGLRQALRPTVWLAFWALALAAFLLSLYVGAGPYAWRIQLLSAVLGCVVAALSVQALPQRAEVASLVLVLLAVAQLVVAQPAVAASALTEQQTHFERAAVPMLPKRAEILAVLSAPFDHPPPLGQLAPGETRVLRDVAHVADLAPSAVERVFLQSAACWVQWPGEERQPLGLHPLCQAVHDRFRLEPLAEFDLPPTREPPLRWAPIPRKSGYRIGFYRLQPRAPR